MIPFVLEMFSAWKKLTVGNKHDGDVVTPPGLQTMSKALQNKFSKGIQYNSELFVFFFLPPFGKIYSGPVSL